MYRFARSAAARRWLSSTTTASGTTTKAAPSTSMIRELRARSSAPMVECKRALIESDLDIDAAVKWLRERGILKAAAASSRPTAQGLVSVAKADDHRFALLVEVNSETDFVARNTEFMKTVREISNAALEHAMSAKDASIDVQSLSKVQLPDGRSVADSIADTVIAVGENVVLRGVAALQIRDGEKGVVASYLHNQVSENLGQIGTLVALRSSSDDRDKLVDLGKQLAMHITVAKPVSVSKESMPADIIEAEKSILVEQAKTAGGKAAFLDKIISGRMEKFFAENVLEEQMFALGDDRVTIKQMVADAEKEIGDKIIIDSFKRVRIGENVDETQAP